MTLIEFLEARITDDEVRATMREWHAMDCDWIPDADGYTYPCDCGVSERLKAECEAKRAIIAKLAERAKALDEMWWFEGDVADPILYSIASVYADHKDFQPEWVQ